MLSQVLTVALAATSIVGAAIPSYTASCHSLWNSTLLNLPDLEVISVENFPDGTNFSVPSVAYPGFSANLPAFCRFNAYIHTSKVSKVNFEVWLPTVWSGKYAFVGNGGDAGGVNHLDMAVPMSKYRLAVASTDTGHVGSVANGTYAIGNSESQLDFGYRAVHLTTVYSKKVIELFYGTPPAYSYALGCSSGGKQGLKEIQEYPGDYDGVIAGAAAQFWSHLLGEIYWINAIVNPKGSVGYMAATDYALVHAAVMTQCDGIDGVVDGIITNPYACKPDLSGLSCDPSGANKTACLTVAQTATMTTIWSDWNDSNGNMLFPPYLVGSEAAGFSVNGSPFPLAPDYFNYQVLNSTTVGPFSANESTLEQLVYLADQTDPGKIIAKKTDISEFLKRGKLISYVGLADNLIPASSSILYFNQVQEALGDTSDSYRMFGIAGMQHCSGGVSAFNFGGPGQRDVSQGGASQSLVFDRKHDMLLALMAWVEEGHAPDSIIGTKFVDDDINLGVAFSRKHCVYPQQGVFLGGDLDSTNANNFECRYV